MKKTLYLIICCLLYTAVIFAEYEVESTKFANVQWSEPPADGTLPEAISWEMELTLVGGKKFSLSSKETKVALLSDLPAKGNIIEIVKESYFPENPEFSWFEIYDLNTNQTSLAKGLSIQEKPKGSDVNTYIVKNANLKPQEGSPKWVLSFVIDEVPFSLESDSKYFVDYYNGLELSFTGVVEREHAEKKFRDHYIFFHPGLKENVTLTTFWSYPETLLKIVSYKLFDLESEGPRSNGRSSEIYRWKQRLSLNDGSEIVFKGQGGGHRLIFCQLVSDKQECLKEAKNWGLWGPEMGPNPPLNVYFDEGDDIQILEEMPSLDEAKLSKFKVLNLKNQREFELEGEKRSFPVIKPMLP